MTGEVSQGPLPGRIALVLPVRPIGDYNPRDLEVHAHMRKTTLYSRSSRSTPTPTDRPPAPTAPEPAAGGQAREHPAAPPQGLRPPGRWSGPLTRYDRPLWMIAGALFAV